MSVSPTKILAHLDELKKWQQLQMQKFMQQHNRKIEVNKDLLSTASCYRNVINTPSVFNSDVNKLSNFENTVSNPMKDIDILDKVEEMSYEETRMNLKRPFLRKGSGLARFRMNPGDQLKCCAKNVRQSGKCIVDLTDERNINSNDFIVNYKIKAKKHSKEEVVPTPLKVPDVNMLPLNKRHKIADTKYGVFDKEIDKVGDGSCSVPISQQLLSSTSADGSKGMIKLPKKNVIHHSLTVVQPNQEVAACRFVPVQENNHTYQDDKVLDLEITHCSKNTTLTPEDECREGEQTVYEKALEKELLIFEALEQRAVHSSFCSTNSSIIRILSSTPQKCKLREGQAVSERHENNAACTDAITSVENSSKCENTEVPDYGENIRNKDFNVDVRTEVVRNYIVGNTSSNLLEQNFDFKNGTASSSRSASSEDLRDETLKTAQFWDAEKWSDTSTRSTRESSPNTSVNGTTSTEGCLAEVTNNTTCRTSNAATMTESVETLEKCSPNKELLIEKLRDLEKEVQTFRRENKRLKNMQKILEKERWEFSNERKEFFRTMENEKVNLNISLEEEKKKLAKERLMFERYTKEVQNRPTKKEREELSSLKQEIATLKETSKLKETKNAMTQARLRNQIKSLNKENVELKEEIEKLNKQNAKLVATQRRGIKSVTDTKILHEINRNLSKLANDPKVSEKLEILEKSKRKLEEVELCDDRIGQEVEGSDSDVENQVPIRKETEQTSPHSYFDRVRELNNVHPSQYCRDTNSHRLLPNRCSYKEKCISGEIPDTGGSEQPTDASLERNYDEVFSTHRLLQNLSDSNSESGSKSDRVEGTLSDGTREIRYTNGNMKIVSPDGNYIKLNYYNGDIKETDLLKGIMKYYYAGSGTRHTTCSDGVELFEFSNGQTEEKYKDGTCKITFPDGAIRNVLANGTEIINYPDGTKVTINNDGERVLLLPNGQKEVHTEEHKRREYPDGTVKILYPDGIQETRYANGRIRLKDKDGKLLMDSQDCVAN